MAPCQSGCGQDYISYVREHIFQPADMTHSKDKEYGYGFMLRHEHGHPTFGHGGGFPGVCTQLEVYPKGGYVVIMLSNFNPMMGNTIADKVRRMVIAG